MPIRQQSIRIQDITPPKMMDESACLKMLTTYAAYTIRKCPPRDLKKEGRGTWARAEIIEERWPQDDIIKQIKKLGESRRSVADKKKALAHNMQGQITTLVDNLASTEGDRAFEWSLVQLDTVQKPVSLRGGKRGGLYETVTMTAFAKRSPRKDLNPVILFENIEKMKQERMRPPPPPQGQPEGGLPQGVTQIFEVGGGKEGGGKMQGGKERSKSREKKYHEHDDSSTDSSSSDTDSSSSHTGSDSLRTSISSKSRSDHRRHSRDKKAYRSHSRHREPRRAYYLDPPRALSPELHHNADAYGGAPRPYVPDVPRVIPAALPPFDPVAAAYHAGKVDAEAERFAAADRAITRPVERVIERVIEPRPVISYGRMEPRYEPRYIEDRIVDDLRREEDIFRRRERDAEEYIEGRLDGLVDGRRTSEFDRRHTDAFYDRRGSNPVIWTNRHPFAPIQLPRRYASSSTSGW
jgi:hypothetical protein